MLDVRPGAVTFVALGTVALKGDPDSAAEDPIRLSCLAVDEGGSWRLAALPRVGAHGLTGLAMSSGVGPGERPDLRVHAPLVLAEPGQRVEPRELRVAVDEAPSATEKATTSPSTIVESPSSWVLCSVHSMDGGGVLDPRRLHDLAGLHGDAELRGLALVRRRSAAELLFTASTSGP